MPGSKGKGIWWEWDTKSFDKSQANIKRTLRNPRQAGLWNRIVKFLFMSWIAETFRLKGARGGHRSWRPLKPSYKSWKVAHKKAGQPLIFTGHLQASFVQGAPGNAFRQERSSMFFGSRVPHAIYHQAPTKPGQPPKREMIFITERDLRDIGKVVQKWAVSDWGKK